MLYDELDMAAVQAFWSIRLEPSTSEVNSSITTTTAQAQQQQGDLHAKAPVGLRALGGIQFDCQPHVLGAIL